MQIAVVGAGIGGLAAALAHARRGHAVSVFEKEPQVPAFGAGLQLGPNAVKVLRALGIADAAAQAASSPEAITFSAGRQTLLRLPMGKIIEARHGAPFWQIHRADLITCLLDACTQAGVTIQTSCPAKVTADGALTLPSGTMMTADHTIAADGVRSSTAQSLFGTQPPPFAQQVAWRATYPIERAPADAQVWLAPGAHIVSYPLRRGTLMNIVAVHNTPDETSESWYGAADPDALRATFASFPPEARKRLEPVDAVRTWGLYSHLERDRWTRGRVTLLGDAAHPMLPFMAQGAAMAIEDAWVHAACVQRGRPEEYETIRKPRTSRVQSVSTRNGTVYHAKGPARIARNLALRALNAAPSAMRHTPFDWLYGGDVTA